MDARATSTARSFRGSLTSMQLATTQVSAQSNSESSADLTLAVARADAQAAKGLTTALVDASATAPTSPASSFVRTRARSFDGYMTGGIATAGSRVEAIGGGGVSGASDPFGSGDFAPAKIRSDTQARANLGAANAGGYILARAKGNVLTRGTVTSRTYAGEAAAGQLNIGLAGGPRVPRVTVPGAALGARNATTNATATSDEGTTFPGSSNAAAEGSRVITARSAQPGGGDIVLTMTGDGVAATTGVGAAVAGAANLAVTPGAATIGDYDSEADTTDNEVIARVRGRGPAVAGLLNFAHSHSNGASITGDTIASAQNGPAVGSIVGLANAWLDASNTLTSSSSTTGAPAVSAVVGLSPGTARVTNTLSGTAKTNLGAALSATLANSLIGQDTSAVGASEAESRTGPATSVAASQALGGVTSASQGSSEAVTATGNALSVGNALSGSAFTARSVGTSKAETSEGSSVALGGATSIAADAAASSASSATTDNGNALSSSMTTALGVLQGESNSVAASTTDVGGAGSQSTAISTGKVGQPYRVLGGCLMPDAVFNFRVSNVECQVQG